MAYENYIKAGNPNTPVDELRALMSEKDAAVRRRLAENPRTPEDVLMHLAQDDDPEVRCALVEHERTPIQVIEKLIADENVQVRYTVSGQYTIPVELLESISSQDENPYVRDHARRTLEGIFLEKALKDAGFVAKPGETEKLGDLLNAAGVLSKGQVQELLKQAKEKDLPLGQILVGTRMVPRSVVVAALKAQLAVREGSLSHEEAIFNIKHVWGRM